MSAPPGRLILAGGGGAEDSLPLDQLFASWIGGGKLLYLPVAMDGTGPTYPECLDWLQSVFRPLGVTNIEMCTDLHTLDEQRLADVQAVYIGGGNTYRLLDLLRNSKLDDWLIGFVQRGGKVYGGSAGAIIWGRDIDTSQYADENLVGMRGTRGFDWLGGYAVWCHYVPDHDTTIRSFISQYNLPLLAISERSGVLVENNCITAIGYEPVLRFSRETQSVLKVGESLPIP